MNMIRLGDVDNFEHIKQVADKVEKKRILSSMKLSDEELEIASQYVKEHESKHSESMASLSRLTGLSAPCLRGIRDKKSNTMHTKTYQVFENIINAGLTKSAQEQEAAEIKAEEERIAQEESEKKPNEFEVMSEIDGLLSPLGHDEKYRVIDYFIMKYGSEIVAELQVREKERNRESGFRFPPTPAFFRG